MIIISYSNNNILPGLSGISISSTFSDYYSNPKQQNKFEQQIQDHQTTKKVNEQLYSQIISIMFMIIKVLI